MAWKSDDLEKMVFDSVTLTPLTEAEMVALLNRVIKKIKALPKVTVRPVGWIGMEFTK